MLAASAAAAVQALEGRVQELPAPLRPAATPTEAALATAIRRAHPLYTPMVLRFLQARPPALGWRVECTATAKPAWQHIGAMVLCLQVHGTEVGIVSPHSSSVRRCVHLFDQTVWAPVAAQRAKLLRWALFLLWPRLI